MQEKWKIFEKKKEIKLIMPFHSKMYIRSFRKSMLMMKCFKIVNINFNVRPGFCS